jgi:DNA-binding HxlR family transcriptional regulator
MEENNMSTMKRMGIGVLNDIFHEGPATRKALWKRNPICRWEMFKRLLGKLVVDGVVVRQVKCPEGGTDPAVDTFALTEEGREIAQLVQ